MRCPSLQCSPGPSKTKRAKNTPLSLSCVRVVETFNRYSDQKKDTGEHRTKKANKRTRTIFPMSYLTALDRQQNNANTGAIMNNANDDALVIEELERTVQNQADTIEALHLAAAKYKNRLDIVEQQLLDREAEVGSLSVLSQENSMLRTEVIDLREAIRTLEQSTARIMDKNTLGSETHAQLGVRVQAYQRHNSYLQGELSERERKIKMLQDKIDMLSEENLTKDRRIAVMLEKLRQHNIDPSSTVMSVRVPEETFATMKVKLTSQATTIELLHEKIESLMDEAERKAALIEAVQKENKALRVSVQKLIAQVTQTANEPMAEEDGSHIVVDSSSPTANYLTAALPVGATVRTSSPRRGGGDAAAEGGVKGKNNNTSNIDAPADTSKPQQLSNGFPAFGSGLSSIEQRLAAFRQRNPRLN